MVYNIVQLLKAFTQGNFANVGKYVFYILNAIGALLVWNDKEAEITILLVLFLLKMWYNN